MIPATFFEEMVCTVVGMCPFNTVPKGMGVNPLVSAFFKASPTVSPIEARTLSPAREESQPANAKAGASNSRLSWAPFTVFTTE